MEHEKVYLENVVKENHTLKETIKEMEASAEVEFEMKMKNLQEAYANAKNKSDLQETQISDFREELLRVKREKQELKENI